MVAGIVGTIVFSSNSYSSADRPLNLLREVAGKSGVRLPDQAIAARSRVVEVNRAQLRSGRLAVRLPQGLELRAVRDHQQEFGNGRFAWSGRIEGKRSERVIMAASGNSVAGSILHAGRLYKLEPRADGSHVISEVLTSDPAPALDPIPVADETMGDSVGGAAPVAADGNTGIDVLVAYTPAVEARYGKAGAEALALLAVAETNQAYLNSGIDARLNLVHLTRTNYTEAGSMQTDLVRLRHASDGYMDELHTLREAYNADMVSLIEDEPASCGIAYRMASLSPSFASSAFSVVHHSCATGYFSFGHELGHNQGAHHDHANAVAAIYPYSYGHNDMLAGFRTIMSYNCSGGCTRVDHFSNPEMNYNNAPTGVTGYADNRQTLNNTAATVAGFRQPLEQLPAAPSDLRAAAQSAGAIELHWQDNSNNESGFILQRRSASGTYSPVASLTANTTAYVDDGLAPDSLYYYRIKGWNSSGDSAFSDEAVAATEVATANPDGIVYAGDDLPVAGLVSGSYLQTWDEDGVYQLVQEVSSGGSPSSRYGYLEHQWVFQMPLGDGVLFSARASTSSAEESFTFSYSFDGFSFSDMFAVTGGSPAVQYFSLPASASGAVYVRVQDDTRVPGVDVPRSVQIDQLTIFSAGNSALPPGC
tara:strand:+ start:35003 stop:36943 length:1941 start_codon:yes stop_codon:yes gene_type:complete